MLALVWGALNDVFDPELPAISIIEMGMVADVELESLSDDKYHARISVMPTFVGCPALDIIKRDVMQKVMSLDFIVSSYVDFIFDPLWSSDLITESGKLKLKQLGIASPNKLKDGQSCPYCDSDNSKIINLFGPTACRAIFYCKNCKQPFESMKKI